MAGSSKVASNKGEFLACAGPEFPPPSTSMVAQRFLRGNEASAAICSPIPVQSCILIALSAHATIIETAQRVVGQTVAVFCGGKKQTERGPQSASTPLFIGAEVGI